MKPSQQKANKKWRDSNKEMMSEYAKEHRVFHAIVNQNKRGD